jgi:hypothetical protein
LVTTAVTSSSVRIPQTSTGGSQAAVSALVAVRPLLGRAKPAGIGARSAMCAMLAHAGHSPRAPTEPKEVGVLACRSRGMQEASRPQAQRPLVHLWHSVTVLLRFDRHTQILL